MCFQHVCCQEMCRGLFTFHGWGLCNTEAGGFRKRHCLQCRIHQDIFRYFYTSTQTLFAACASLPCSWHS